MRLWRPGCRRCRRCKSSLMTWRHKSKGPWHRGLSAMFFSSPSNWCARIKKTRPTHWRQHPKKGNAFRPSPYLAWGQAPQRGKKGKKRGQIGKILVSEASLAMVWEGGKRRRLFPLPRLPLGSLRSPISFPFSPNAEPSLKLLSSLPFPPSIPVIFFLFFWSRLSNFSTNSTGDACYAAEKLMVRRNLHYHLKKHENGARHCIFNLVHLIAHQTLEPFSSKHFAVEDYYPINLVPRVFLREKPWGRGCYPITLWWCC